MGKYFYPPKGVNATMKHWVIGSEREKKDFTEI